MIKSFYYQSNNAGDTLTPIIVEFFTGQKVEFVERNAQGKLLAVGSIMKALRPNDVVWGAGIMRKTDTFPSVLKAKFLAVRGRRSADILRQAGAEVPEVYGDPALLLPLIYKPKTQLKYKMGIIPHYIEHNDPVFKRLKTSENELMIDITQPWQKVIDDILSCEFIVSSSLHGLIIAEAYNVPVQWLKVSDKVLGNGFKFEDYLTGTGRILPEPHTLPNEKENDFKALYAFQPIDPQLLAQIQNNLINSLKKHYA